MITSSKDVSPIYVTIHGQPDGVGSQMMSKASGIAYARAKGYTYVHTSLANVDHLNRTTINEMENFFNIGHSEIQRKSLPHDISYICVAPKDNLSVFDTLQKKPVLVQTLFFHNQIEKNTPSDYYTQEIRDLFRERYALTNKPELGWDKNKYHIAIHLRRGDVKKKLHPNRWIENETYKKVMDRLRIESNVYCVNNVQFHVYSEGNVNDFKELINSDVVFHLNEPVALSMHGMISADELVMGKSGFSYIAGLYSRGKVHYFPFWHSPLDDWIIEQELS